MEEDLKALWVAACVHSMTHMGEELSEEYSAENPPSDLEIISLVTGYLEQTV